MQDAPAAGESQHAFGGAGMKPYEVVQQSLELLDSPLIAVPVPDQITFLQFDHARHVILGVDRQFQAVSFSLQTLKGDRPRFSHTRLI